MAYFRKSGRGWRAEIEKHGVRDSASFPTKREAQEWAAKREAEIVAGSSGQVIRVTLSEAIDRYIEEITPSKASARSEKLRLRALQRHPLAKKIMQDITPADLAAWRDERLSKVQPASVIRETNSLKALWRQAKRLEWNYVDHEPWKEVTTPKAPPARTQAYTQAQVDKIVAALGYEGGRPKTRKHEAAIAFLLSLETAMRAGEIVSLEWRHIDIDAMTAYLPKTKNSDDRYVPLSSRARELISRMDGVDKKKVFTISPGVLSTYFRSARNAAGIEGLTFHDARATAITQLSKRLDILELARMVGHRDPRSLMVYYRASPTDIAKKLG